MFFPVLWSLDRQWACRMHCSCLFELCWLLDVTCLLANCRAYIRADRDFGWALSRQSFPLPLGSEWCPDLVSCNWLPNADCGDSLEWPADENDEGVKNLLVVVLLLGFIIFVDIHLYSSLFVVSRRDIEYRWCCRCRLKLEWFQSMKSQQSFVFVELILWKIALLFSPSHLQEADDRSYRRQATKSKWTFCFEKLLARV